MEDKLILIVGKSTTSVCLWVTSEPMAVGDTIHMCAGGNYI